MIPSLALFLLLAALAWVGYLALSGVEAGRRWDADLPLLLEDPHTHQWRAHGSTWDCDTCHHREPRTRETS